jgi:hypothetical protein
MSYQSVLIDKFSYYMVLQMCMDEIEMKILRLIHEEEYTNSDKIAQTLNIQHQETVDFLDMLEFQGYVRLMRFLGGKYDASLTFQGRLLLTHPEYMFNKGYGDASDVLKALEKAVNDSDAIPQHEKESLSGKLKDLYYDPYMQGIGSGLIIEGLKKLVGM